MHTLSELGQGKFSVIGHRGASAHAPENTAEAYQLAETHGADGIEIDVRRTSDGGMVVHHDATIADIGAIVEHTYDELRTRVPWLLNLDEMLAAAGDMWVNVEIKNNPGDLDFDETDKVAAEVVRWIQRDNLYERALVSCFNPATIDQVRELDPAIATGWLTDVFLDPRQTVGPASERGHQAIHPHYSTLTDEVLVDLVPAAKEAGLHILTWTVDDPATIRRLADAGVTGAFTNDPRAALAALAN